MSIKENNIPGEQQTVANNETESKEKHLIGNNNPDIIDDPQFLCSLHKLVIKIFTVDEEIPTLPKILIEATNQLNFNGSKNMLRKILKAKLGFQFRRCKNNGPIPLERHKIALARAEYLNTVIKNDSLQSNKQSVIYLDETLIYLDERAKDSSTDVWCIMHAGGENGFLANTCLIYKCTLMKKGGSLIDQNLFLKWLNEKLLPNLPPNSIVILDDATQHNKLKEIIPDYRSSKQTCMDWLQKHNIEYKDNCTLVELRVLISKNVPKINYSADCTLIAAGHTVFRLPFYSDLSPMGNIWDIIKKRIAKKREEKPQNSFEKNIEEGVASVTKEDWEKQLQHVKKLEREYYDNDHKWDDENDKLDISFENPDSDEYSFPSSDADYDTDFSGTDVSDDSDADSNVSSEGSYMSSDSEAYADFSDDSDKKGSYNI